MKIAAIIFAILCIASCDPARSQTSETVRYSLAVKGTSVLIEEKCISGIVYYVSTSGGIAPKYNAATNIATCNPGGRP